MRFVISSDPDKEKLFVEIWTAEDQLLAEINQEQDVLMVELYARPDGQPWILPFEELAGALTFAKQHLASGLLE